MANTYTQSYFHLIFTPKNRDALIKKSWKVDLEKYITGIVQNHKHKLLAIGSMPDHIHIFIGYNLNHLIPDLVEEIKTSSNKWIKQNKLSKFHFESVRLYFLELQTNKKYKVELIPKAKLIGISGLITRFAHERSSTLFAAR